MMESRHMRAIATARRSNDCPGSLCRNLLQFPSMPMSVIQAIRVDYSVPLQEIVPLLNELSHETVEEKGEHRMPDEIEIEARIAHQEMNSDELIASVERLGKISTLTCPECNGALWEIDDHEILRYRCHVGLALSARLCLAWPNSYA